MPNPYGDEWEEMYKRYEKAMGFLDFLNPEALLDYLSIDAVIKRRMFPNIAPKQAFQEAFEMMVEGVLPEEKATIDYVNKIIEVGRTIGLELELSPTLRSSLERKQEQADEATREQQRANIVRREGKPLEEQLEDAVAADNFEEAARLRDQIARLRRLRGLNPDTGGRPTNASDKYKGTLHIGEMEE